VVIKVARDERDVEIAALADRLAVIHRFQDSETARMFLYEACERVQVTRARVIGEGLPCRKRGACRLDGRVHVSG